MCDKVIGNLQDDRSVKVWEERGWVGLYIATYMAPIFLCIRLRSPRSALYGRETGNRCLPRTTPPTVPPPLNSFVIFTKKKKNNEQAQSFKF